MSISSIVFGIASTGARDFLVDSNSQDRNAETVNKQLLHVIYVSVRREMMISETET